jgi:hypothetical protein
MRQKTTSQGQKLQVFFQIIFLTLELYRLIVVVSERHQGERPCRGHSAV